tara:strand:+ start:170 stop:337 length:168 start_codon:yes stop_codon:yes gene_type:complete
MKKISLDNIKEIKIEKCVVHIVYNDGVKFIIKDDIKIIKGLINKNTDGPIVDHCI